MIRLAPAGGPGNLDKTDQIDKLSEQQPFFLVQVSPERVQHEKEKARDLRKTRWWQRQMARGICFYCRKPVVRDQMTLDHIVPLIRGGQSNRNNVVLACRNCNSRKKYFLPMEWQEFLQGVDSQDEADRSAPDLPNPHETSDGE